MMNRFLTLKEAASHIDRTERWMRRHWPNLKRDGVNVLRMPKDAPKGRLMFEKASLDGYLEACRIQTGNWV